MPFAKPEKQLAYQRKYRKANREKIRERDRAGDDPKILEAAAAYLRTGGIQ